MILALILRIAILNNLIILKEGVFDCDIYRIHPLFILQFLQDLVNGVKLNHQVLIDLLPSDSMLPFSQQVLDAYRVQ